MKNIWFISDTHFGHENTFKEFKRPDGSPLREFSSVEEMNERMIENWNAVVNENDRVYHCGDVVINKKYLGLVLPRLKGKKVLLMGNHDIFGHKEYLKYFEDIRAYKVFTGQKIVCCHMPIIKSTLGTRWKANIHGHLHDKVVTKEDGSMDERYVNVSVEQISYTPINFDSILKDV